MICVDGHGAPAGECVGLDNAQQVAGRLVVAHFGGEGSDGGCPSGERACAPVPRQREKSTIRERKDTVTTCQVGR